MLKPKEYFALAVRIIGVVVTLYGVRYLADFSLGQMGYFTLQKTDYAYYLVLGIGFLIVGVYLLRGAPWVVNHTYPDDEATEEKAENESNENGAIENQDGE